VRAIVDGLPTPGRKPVYVTEYGVRGLRTFNGRSAGDPGVWVDGTPLNEANATAFQHAWFDVLSARLGYVGTSKWDLYFGRYDRGIQSYYFVGGPSSGWPRHPLYNLLYLLTHSVRPGWRIVGVDAVAGTSRLVVVYAGRPSEWTVVGLDSSGAQLNDESSEQVAYSVGGLPASENFRLFVWNELGDGLIGAPTPVSTDAAGTASFTVPVQGVFMLTTISGSPAPHSPAP
jgi:hypothetical protein